MVFLALFLIPALIAIGFFVFTKSTITLKEFLLQMVLQAVIAGASVGIIYHRNTSDTEVVNGQVTGKSSDRTSCSHSYSCNCRMSCSGSGKTRSCHQVCSTCYRHSYDMNWNVRSDIGSTSISREDSQGLIEPRRWTQVKVGEPFSMTNSFTNFIKAAPDTLFRHQGLVRKYQTSLPEYPSNIYDYYRIDRLVSVGGKISNESNWNFGLSEINKEIGQSKQVNMAIVFAFNKPKEYFYALEQHWIGAKKNDVILVIGTNNGEDISWVDVMGWTNNPLYKIKLRDRVLSLGKIESNLVLQSLKEETESGYVRKPMKDFEYLEASITPSVTEWIVSIVIGLITSVVMGMAMHKNDVFNEELSNNNYNRF